MCVEAAICYALGLPHGDDPGCVEPAVRAFKIRLNDQPWSSTASRAKGLRALAVAQLGSKGAIDGHEFTRRLVEQTIRHIVPLALRAAVRHNPHHAATLEAAAVRCEQDGTREAALKGKAAAYAAAEYDACDASSEAAYAASSDVAIYAAIYVAIYAAAADADDAAERRDGALMLMAEIGLRILRDMHAPGVALWDAVMHERTERSLKEAK
jgi:hypothetical protein